MTELREQLDRFRSSSSVLEGDGRQPEPTAEELAHPIVAPGSDALLPEGIVYQAGWEPVADGIARHARLAARALGRTGLPVTLRSQPIKRMELDDELDPAVVSEIDHLRKTSIGSAALAIRQVIIHSHLFLENVVAPYGARYSGFENELAVYKSTIVYTSWERSTVHPEVVAVLNRCGRVWVPCQMNYNVFRNAGVRRVDVIPCPFEPNDDRTLVERKKDPATGKVVTTIREIRPTSFIPSPRGSEDVPTGKRFYAIGKWEPRKNYHALVGAFLSEFGAGERASLLLKTHEWGAWKDYPSVAQSVDFWLGTAAVRANGWTPENFSRNVAIVTKKLPDEALYLLHKKNNIYVTCSHGEAWDLPAFDAKAAGNRLVYTGWGGAEDYADPGSDYMISLNTELEPVHSGYGWESDACWKTCTVEEIRKALRASEPPARRVLPPELVRRFGFRAVGSLMLRSIEELSGEAYERLRLTGGFG